MFLRTIIFVILLYSLITASYFFVVPSSQNTQSLSQKIPTSESPLTTDYEPQSLPSSKITEEVSSISIFTEPASSTVPESTLREETEKRWTLARAKKNPHVSSPSKKLNAYSNTDFNLFFTFDPNLILTRDSQNDKAGTLFIDLENPELYPHFIRISIREGKRFNAEQDAYEHDITYYNWNAVYENFRNKIPQRWEDLGHNERLATVNNKKFLKRVVYDPERDHYELSFLTYENGVEYDIALVFYNNAIKETDQQLTNEFQYLANAMLENKFKDSAIVKGTQYLEAIVDSLRLGK
jgi:hypothetical protein